MEQVAVAWALDEAESQLGREPAHRVGDSQREYAWSLTAPNGVGVYVEAVRGPAAASTTLDFALEASAAGLFCRTRDQRRVAVSLEGDAAREPALLYLGRFATLPSATDGA